MAYANWLMLGYSPLMDWWPVAVPIYGKLGDLYGRRRLMLSLPYSGIVAMEAST